MHSVRSTNLSLKFLRFTPPGCKDIKIRTFQFVAKTQFLWSLSTKILNINLSFSYFNNILVKNIRKKRYILEEKSGSFERNEMKSEATNRFAFYPIPSDDPLTCLHTA